MTTTPSNSPVSPLRQKLIDDMTMRHFSAAWSAPHFDRTGGIADKA